MPSRRSHTNSHHGCLRCKSKRVKCDQTQPKCVRCQKRGAECIYRHLMSSYDPFIHHSDPIPQPSVGRPPMFRVVSAPWPESPCSKQSSSPTSELSTSPSGSAEYLPSSYALERNVQSLLHHYINNLAVKHMAPVLESKLFPILNPAITRNAIMHPYVQEAVLCYSALHLASAAGGGSPTSRSPYLVAALRHKAKALAHFRPMLAAGITAENCEAAFTASTVLVACAFALPVSDPANSTNCDRIEILAQVIGLFRGCLALFRLNWKGPHPLQQFRAPEVRQSIKESYSCEIPWPVAERSVENVVRVVQQLDESTPVAQQRKGALLHAGLALQKVMRLVAASQSDYSVVCMWLGKVTEEYNNLLRDRDPLALVLMAHWCASRNHYSEDVWWTRNWPETAMTSILEALDGQYTELLGWCLSEIGIPPPEPRRRSIMEDASSVWYPTIPA